VTRTGHGSTLIGLPNDREVLITREFEAPIALVFDVLTKPEHVSKWFAGPGEEMKECSIDLRVGGNYHFVFVTEDGIEMSFRGTFLQVEPPTRTVQTWLFEGRHVWRREYAPADASAGRSATACAATLYTSGAATARIAERSLGARSLCMGIGPSRRLR
jgi:uncharacterized protein YndB with AHSA1/START domain